METVVEYLSSGFAQNILQFIELCAVIAGFYLGIRELKHSNDSRNVDFIIEAEGQIDPVFLQVATVDPDTARRVLPNLIPAELPSVEVPAFLLTYFAYRHTSRIYYMVANSQVSIGMGEKDRKELMDEWTNELKKYNIDYLAQIHRFSLISGEFNPAFMSFMNIYLKDKLAPKPAAAAA